MMGTFASTKADQRQGLGFSSNGGQSNLWRKKTLSLVAEAEAEARNASGYRSRALIPLPHQDSQQHHISVRRYSAHNCPLSGLADQGRAGSAGRRQLCILVCRFLATYHRATSAGSN